MNINKVIKYKIFILFLGVFENSIYCRLFQRCRAAKIPENCFLIDGKNFQSKLNSYSTGKHIIVDY